MTQKSRHKRIKVGRLPGDFPFALLNRLIDKGREYTTSWGQHLSGTLIARSFAKRRRGKSRATLKERTRREIDNELNEPNT